MAFENGINMFDTAEAYAKGKSEEEMYVLSNLRFIEPSLIILSPRLYRGRVIKELGLRRTDLIISTKLYWGLRGGPNDGGLSRKQ